MNETKNKRDLRSRTINTNTNNKGFGEFNRKVTDQDQVDEEEDDDDLCTEAEKWEDNLKKKKYLDILKTGKDSEGSLFYSDVNTQKTLFEHNYDSLFENIKKREQRETVPLVDSLEKII